MRKFGYFLALLIGITVTLPSQAPTLSQATCAAYLANNTNPAGIPSVSGPGVAVSMAANLPWPNSHFYTADAEECSYLKQLEATIPATEKRWNFESMDFSTTAPTNSLCPDGTTPIYHAYNNGFARSIDSNHRITSNTTALQEFAARGWIDEGVVMCAPQ
ncbi:MAG: hypothetical protein Q8P42_07090 [Gallionella sp.]|nr:hypothetical protein [Gallionella sp.]